jgi:hypothetical protein
MVEKTPPPIRWEPIEIEHRGKTYRGEFSVSNGTVTVRYWFKHAARIKPGWHHGPNPESTARRLLGELVDEFERKSPTQG